MVLINNNILLTWYWSTIEYCSRGTDQQSDTAHVVLINNYILLTWYWSTIKYCSCGTDQQSDTAHVVLINNQILLMWYWATITCNNPLMSPMHESEREPLRAITLFINFKYVVLVLSSCFTQEQFEDIKGVMRCRK